MSIIIEIPSALTKYTNRQDEIPVDAATVKEAVDGLVAQYPTLKQHLYEENGKIRSFINVYLNDEDIRYADNLETQTKSGDRIQIVPSVAGGTS